MTAESATRIVVAEDDRDIADLIAHYLQKAGWVAHVSPTGDEALSYIRQQRVDVVILDVMLPGLSGLEVCRALRADSATASMPIIMVTARAEETDRIVQRDANDATQTVQAKDAVLIDTTYLTQPEQVDRIVALARAVTHRGGDGSPVDDQRT